MSRFCSRCRKTNWKKLRELKWDPFIRGGGLAFWINVSTEGLCPLLSTCLCWGAIGLFISPDSVVFREIGT